MEIFLSFLFYLENELQNCRGKCIFYLCAIQEKNSISLNIEDYRFYSKLVISTNIAPNFF